MYFKTGQQIIEKIEILKTEPLKGSLQDFRSIRSVGKRYRIIY
jgi:hypothetical protein